VEGELDEELIKTESFIQDQCCVFSM